MNPATLDAVISEKTRAIIVVHSFGFPAPAAEIIDFARRHSLAVIEDTCEALGAECQGDKAGTLGDVGIFAFYPNKLITTGEGGALVTRSHALAARFRSLRNQGRLGTDWWQHHEPGFSYRLSDINCALGRQQLARIEETLRRREELAASYRRRLQSNTDLSCFGAEKSHERVSWFTYPILLEDSFTRQHRDEVWAELRRRGIESGRYFAPSHLQPALRGAAFRYGDLTATVSVSGRLLCLPLFHSLSELEIDSVCAALDEILRDRAAWGGRVQAAVNW
jgi:perosamine synthetase